MKHNSRTLRVNFLSPVSKVSRLCRAGTALMSGMAALTISFESGASPGSENASTTKVFGLPIGGVLKPAPRVCNLGEVSKGTTKVVCWLEKPTATKDGSKIGILHLPDPDSRPEWAAYAEFSAIVGSGGVLEWVRVKAQNEGKKHLIASSISKRFGNPVQAPLPGDFAYATWRAEGLQIDQVCDFLNCRISFKPAPTQAQQAQADEAFEASLRRRSARPAAP